MNRNAATADQLPTGWAQGLRDFTAYLDRKGTVRADTADAYRLRLATVGRGLGCDPWEVTSEQLGAWIDARNWSNWTRKGHIVALRRFYAWATHAGRVERSPLLGIPEANMPRPGPRQQQPADRWRESIRAYLDTLRAAGQRPQSVNLRRWSLTSVSHHFADPWTVTPGDLAALLSRPDWSPSSRKTMRAAVVGFYRWAVKTGRTLDDPSADLAPVRVPRSLPRPAPTEAVTAALGIADDRVRLALAFGVYAGLRIGEIAQLQTTDILAGRILVNGKGGHQRYVPMHPELARIVAVELARHDTRGPNPPWLFPSQAGRHLTPGYLGRLVADALPGDWTAHTLRHRFATQAYAANRDLRAVQELLGHVRPETTARYAAVPADALTAAVLGVGI